LLWKKIARKKKKPLALEIICRNQEKNLLWKFAENRKPCSGVFLQKKEINLALEICRKQKTWSESLQKTGNLVSKLAFMI